MSQNKNLALLQTNKLFEGVEESEIHVDLDQEGISFYKEGDIIYQGEDSSNTLFLIIEGDVKIKIPKDEGSPTILRKGKGEYFGELELLEKIPRRSSAVANKDCLVYKLMEDKLKELIATDKKIERNLLNLNPYEKDAADENTPEQSEENPEVTDGDTQINEPEDTAPVEIGEDTPSDLSLDEINEQEENITTEQFQNSDIEDFKLDDLTLPQINLDEFDKSLDEELPKENFEEPVKDIEYPEEAEQENLPDDYVNQEEIQTEEAKTEEVKSDIEWGFGEQNENIETEQNEPITESELDLPKETEFVKEENDLLDSEEQIEIHTPQSDKELLSAIKDIHTHIELNKTLNSISASLKQLIHAESLRIFLPDEEKNELLYLTDGGQESERVPFGKGLVGYSAENKEVLNLSVPADDLRYDAEVDENVNTLLFPVLIQEKELIAVLRFTNTEKSNFTKSDEEILSEISVHVASAIINAKQYQSLLKRYKSDYLVKAADFIIEDVNTPLMLIKNYAEFIKRKSEVKEVKQISDFIIEQADLAINSNKTFHNFLTEEKLIEPQVYKLNEVLDDILDQLAEYVEIRKVKLFKRFETDAEVRMDKNTFYLACFQIAKNACDAMPDGGNIYLITKRENKTLHIEFKDTGKGIGEDIREKIFEPYFSSGKGPAAGLGLAVAEKIIRDHDGSITTGEGLGEGAVFIITLPIYEGTQGRSN